jgi:hypothetical protein
MRRIEERTLIVSEAVILIFIIFVSIFLQTVDVKIKNYNDKISLAELRRSQYLPLSSFWSQKAGYWELFGFLNKSNLGVHLKKKFVNLDEKYLDEETKLLLGKFENDQINEQESIDKMADYSIRKARYYESRVNETGAIIENMYKDPPSFFCINAFLFQRLCFIIQIIGVIFAAIIYRFLFVRIGRRIQNNR